MNSYLFNSKNNTPFIVISAACHALLFLFCIYKFNFSQDSAASQFAAKPSENQPNIIKAVAIDQKLVDQQVAKLEQLEKKQQEREKLKQAKLQEQKLNEAKKLEQRKLELAKEAKLLEERKLEIAKKELEAKEQVKKAEEHKKNLEKIAKVQEQKQKEAKKQELLKKLIQNEENKLLTDLDAEAKALEANLEAERLREAQQQREIGRIQNLLKAKVQRNWISNETFLGHGYKAKFLIKLNEEGIVLNVSLIKSSGNAAFDASARNAILKSSPLPVPSDKALTKNLEYSFLFNPDNLG
jgi:colicin import membrane protein